MNKSRAIGRTLLFLIAYCTLGAVVYFASLLMLQHGVLFNAPWFATAQKSLYRAGMSDNATNWLALPGCITPDPELIYKPSTGSCEFNQIEFRTTLNFTEAGRYTGDKPLGTGIAVIGDSHAMGWGVNDLETFSAQLQGLSGRPVYNLGVASYGTSRELIRLKNSGLLDKIDTVIIQYCNNDYHENLMFDTALRQELHEKVFGQTGTDELQQPDMLKHIIKGYWLTLKAPIKSLADRLRRKNFTRHYNVLIDTLQKQYDVLRGKRVIVFYSNPYGQKYRNFPTGRDARLPEVSFVDLDLNQADYRKLDNHLTPAGHRKVAEGLFKYLQSAP
ncbi:MAG: SGNH/GDSL hydrolase family protein [Gammaproteobacteria bacterium]